MSSELLFNVSTISQGVGNLVLALICLLHFKKKGIEVKLLGVYGAISFSFSALDEFLYFFQTGKTLTSGNYIGNTFVFMEAFIFSLIYYFSTSKVFKNLSLILLVIFILIYAISFTYINYYFSVIRTTRDILLIILALMFFYYLLKELPQSDLKKYPMFWINAAVICYFSGTFFLSFFRDYIVVVLKDNTIYFWAYRNFFRLGFCLVLSYAAWLNYRQVRDNNVLKKGSI